ncbi:hypothetical protein [Quadrisphaera sp. DSM 44207]|uniref:hypothetical protein n=1 Tax=Quadrisphaera sp. DSM 44207 TaxID=1881057 RepID=UPI00088C6013|nr:hypothetical protein [Quadrisphaera sp. DSM 44207]SDQ68064.1 hypothetical protein SAMN05428996_2362 [Quadrisphaera sp. DSM 44207]
MLAAGPVEQLTTPVAAGSANAGTPRSLTTALTEPVAGSTDLLRPVVPAPEHSSLAQWVLLGAGLTLLAAAVVRLEAADRVRARRRGTSG